MARRRGRSAAEWRAMVEAALLLPATGASLRVGGLRRTWRWLNRPATAPADSPADLIDPVAGAVAAVAYRFPLYRPSCLTRALVLHHLLLRRGIPAELRLGVSTAGGQFAAHVAAGRHFGGMVHAATSFSPPLRCRSSTLHTASTMAW